jgi:squalene synthase HpnC
VDHYENFPVASWLCPPALRPPILSIYHFARTADDLADEGDASSETRLNDLAQYRSDLLRLWQDPNHRSQRWPEVFARLGQQHLQWRFPLSCLQDLLDAFVQDVEFTRSARRYADRAELLDYCRRSANPIGRLLLHLKGVDDAPSLALSDAVCSSLQLINFWQDLSVDVPRGRFYLPVNSTLEVELDFARQLMHQGAPLVHRLSGRLGWELRLVVQGGLRILDKSLQVNTLKNRPVITKWDGLGMLWRAWCM